MKIYQWLFYITAILFCVCKVDQLNAMKLNLVSTMRFQDQKTQVVIKALQEDAADQVEAFLVGVDHHAPIICSELYDQIEPKKRQFAMSLVQLAVLFLAERSLALLLQKDIAIDFEDRAVKGVQGHGPALLLLCRMLQQDELSVGHRMLKMLLEKKANPHVRDTVGTPLTYRVIAGDAESVHLLLQAGACPNVPVLSRRFGTQRIERHFLLRALVHDIEARQEQNSAEMESYIADRMVLMRVLLEAGADPHMHCIALGNDTFFKESSALMVVKDPELKALLQDYKTKTE